MVNQKLISFKCDSDQLALLDATCERLGIKRNHMLNVLVMYANCCLESYNKFLLMVEYSKVRFSDDDDIE